MPAESNPYYIAPPDIYSALMAGQQGYKFADEQATKAKNEALYQQAANELQKGGISDTTLGKLVGIGHDSAATIGALGTVARARGENNKVYGNVVWGTMPDGSTALGTHNASGQFIKLDTGQFNPTPTVHFGDNGQAIIPMNSKTGLPVGQGQSQPQFGGPDTQPVRIPPGMTPDQVTQRYRPGTPIILSDGRQGVVPGAAPQAPVQQGGVYPKDVAGTENLKEGGKLLAEKQAKVGQATAAKDGAVAEFDRLESKALGIQNNPALGKITGVASYIPNWPGGKAADLEAQVETLKSQLTTNVLMAMREASKTGGALGNVSNYEDKLLQSVVASVSQLQSKGAFKEAMQLIVDYARGAKQRVQGAYNEDYGNIKK